MAWYGSLTNRILENQGSPEPEIGMGATEVMYSDREPWEIIGIERNRQGEVRRITLRHMSSKLPEGSPIGSNNWIITPDENGRVITIKKARKNCKSHNKWGNFILGFADKFYDWSF